MEAENRRLKNEIADLQDENGRLKRRQTMLIAAVESKFTNSECFFSTLDVNRYMCD